MATSLLSENDPEAEAMYQKPCAGLTWSTCADNRKCYWDTQNFPRSCKRDARSVGPEEKIDTFYENMIDFARTKSTNRRLTSGIRTKKHSNSDKKEKDIAAMTNIVGYFDSLGPSQKMLLKKHGIKLNPAVRETRFNMLYPDKFKKLIPLIREIDTYY